MIFFEESDSPELDPPELLPLRPGAVEDVADAEEASTTWLVVTTLLKVLLPLIEMIVVTTASALLLCGDNVLVESTEAASVELESELTAKDDWVSELNMKDVDWGWSDEIELLVGANDDTPAFVDDSNESDVASDCDALAEGGKEDDVAADGEVPVLKGTLFWR